MFKQPQGAGVTTQPRGPRSSVEIPSLCHRLRHPLAVFITATSHQETSFIWYCGLFYGLVLELLRVQVFSGAARGPRAALCIFFKGYFKILGFPPLLPILQLNSLPVVRAAMHHKLSCSLAANLSHHKGTELVSTFLYRLQVLLVPFP